MSKQKSIGVFDSGFGGLTILRGIVQKLPAYNYVYLGDTARTPYGTRSPEVVYAFAKQAVDFLFAQGCELVIFACNTASSDALRKIQRHYLPKRYPGKKVLGVLIPAAEEAVAKTLKRKIGVIATPGTVRSNAFVREIKKLDRRMTVFQEACPLFVPLVEAGEHRSKAALLIAKRYLAPLQEKGIDTLILGCTHYGILEKSLRKLLGPAVKIVSEEKVTPQKLKEYLAAHPEIEKRLGKNRTREFYSTDLTPAFSKLGSVFFGKSIRAKRVSLS